MGIFSGIKKAVGKVFGHKPAPIFKPSHKREEEDAVIATQSQDWRRKKQLEKRVNEGKSSQVYKNRKNTGSGESVYLEAFLDGHALGRFASSNVWQIVYDRINHHLHIQYMGGKGKRRSGPGKWYVYSQISELEARTIYNTASKGVWTWDHLRIRGTEKKHQKPYAKNAPPPSYLPLGQPDKKIDEALARAQRKKITGV